MYSRLFSLLRSMDSRPLARTEMLACPILPQVRQPAVHRCGSPESKTRYNQWTDGIVVSRLHLFITS